MRGDGLNSGLRLGVVLSVLLHAGVAYVASTVPMASSAASSVHLRGGSLDGALVAFDATDPALNPTPEDRPEETPEAARLLTTLAPPQLTPEELARKLVLGIDESAQKTDNWMGSAEPTEHKAPLSSVDQPLLDPNPGMPGAPSEAGVSQSGPQAPMVPQAAPAENPVQPTPLEARPVRDGVKAPETMKAEGPTVREGKADGSDRASGEMARPGEDGGTGEKLVRPAKGTMDVRHDDPLLPGPMPEEKGNKGEAEHARPDEITVERPRKVDAPKATAPVTEIVARPESPEHVPGVPNTESPVSPMAPMPAGGPSVSPVPGATGERPGDKSPKEADAASTVATLEIRPGKPAAAEGLDITTKRPNFTRLTRATAYPQANPLYKVTFNRMGIVTRVVMVESSGVADIDGPVLNAIYQWTAKGKLLAEISAADPNGGVTFSVRILLR